VSPFAPYRTNQMFAGIMFAVTSLLIALVVLFVSVLIVKYMREN
jgi:hypothetical protein